MRYLLTLAALVIFTQTSLEAQDVQFSPAGERKSATHEEAAWRGWGDFLRDAGRHMESRSDAYHRFQEAETTRLKNLKEWETMTAPIRHRQAVETMQKQVRRFPPHRLTRNSLSAAGEIKWPAVLLRPEYKERREELQKLCARRAIASPSEQAGLSQAIAESSVAFTGVLNDQVMEHSRTSYLQGARFLRNLAYEAEFPAIAVQHVASNQ